MVSVLDILVVHAIRLLIYRLVSLCNLRKTSFKADAQLVTSEPTSDKQSVTLEKAFLDDTKVLKRGGEDEQTRVSQTSTPDISIRPSPSQQRLGIPTSIRTRENSSEKNVAGLVDLPATVRGPSAPELRRADGAQAFDSDRAEIQNKRPNSVELANGHGSHGTDKRGHNNRSETAFTVGGKRRVTRPRYQREPDYQRYIRQTCKEDNEREYGEILAPNFRHAAKFGCNRSAKEMPDSDDRHMNGSTDNDSRPEFALKLDDCDRVNIQQHFCTGDLGLGTILDEYEKYLIQRSFNDDGRVDRKILDRSSLDNIIFHPENLQIPPQHREVWAIGYDPDGFENLCHVCHLLPWNATCAGCGRNTCENVNCVNHGCRHLDRRAF